MTVMIRANTSQAQRAFRMLRERAPIAVMRALNKSGDSAASIMARTVAKDLGMKVADVRGQFRTTEARTDRLTFRLSTTGKRIPIFDFRARQTRTGVRARIPGYAGVYPHAFIATVRAGATGAHTGVFLRKGKARLPIRELFGPSMPHVFDKYLPIGRQRGQEALAKNLPSEIAFELRQIAKAA